MEQQSPASGVVRILWMALIGSVALLFVVYRLGSHPPAPANATLFPILVLCGVFSGGASLFYTGFLYRQGARKLALETREIPSTIGPDHPNATRRVFVDPEKARGSGNVLYQSTFILSLAFAESVALYGLVLGMRGFRDEQVLPFFGVALALMAFRYPGPRAAEKMLERALGATFP